MKTIYWVCRLTLGILFIFSGFVKSVDPLGSAYKFNEYFASAGLPEMYSISLFLSFLLSGAEFLIGVALFTGLFKNFTAWVALFFMAFFTILTFVLAIFNPVTDCGCFGDAIKLTNWQTFYKNIIFMSLVIFIFRQRHKISSSISIWNELSTCIISIIFFLEVSLYSFNHLPIIDFMPYSIGSDIPAKMHIPIGAPQDIYETQLIYKNVKTGKLQEFNMSNYPWKDTLNWKWDNTKTVLIKKGYVPPIHDFAVTTKQGNNITDSILNDKGYSVLLIAYNINKSDAEGLKKAERLQEFCTTTGKAKFYAVSASASSDVERVKKENGLSIDFCSGDETALKTVVRANPGIIILKEGVVIGKYHYNDFDKISLKTGNFLSENLNDLKNRNENLLALSIFLVLGLILILIFKRK